jgi:hypothetical protein
MWPTDRSQHLRNSFVGWVCREVDMWTVHMKGEGKTCYVEGDKLGMDACVARQVPAGEELWLWKETLGWTW